MTDMSPEEFLGGASTPAAPHPPRPKLVPFQGKGASPEEFLNAGVPKTPAQDTKPLFDWKGLADKIISGVGEEQQNEASMAPNAPAAFTHIAKEGVKALAKGAADLEGVVSRGVAGAGTLAAGKGFGAGANFADKINAKANEITDKIAKVNLAPEGQDGEVLSDLVNALPNGLSKASEFTFTTTKDYLSKIGMDPYHAALAGALAEAGVNAFGTLLMMKPEIATKAMRPLLAKDDAPKPVRKLKGQVESAFDSLVNKDPKAAADLVRHIEPGFEGWTEADETPVQPAGKPRIKLKPQEPTTVQPAGKPRIKLKPQEPITVQPAGKPKIKLKAQPSRTFYEDELHPDLRTPDNPIVQQLKIKINNPKPPDVIGREVVSAQIGDHNAKQNYSDNLWADTGHVLEERGDFDPDENLTAHKFLDRAIRATTDNPVAAGLLMRLRQYVDDVPIFQHNFFKTLAKDKDEVNRKFPGTLPEHYRGATGLYFHPETDAEIARKRARSGWADYGKAGHSVHINTHRTENWIISEATTAERVQTAVHELVHAATVKFMRDNPGHKLTKDIVALRKIAYSRAKKMESVHKFLRENKGKGIDVRQVVGDRVIWPDATDHYGFSDKDTEPPYEFVAEAISNPNFQRFLIDSEEYAGQEHRGLVGKVVDKLATAMSKMLGIKNPAQIQIIHDIFDTTKKIMEEQSKMPTTAQVSSGVSSAMGKISAMADAKEPGPLGEDPTMFMDRGKPVTLGAVNTAFRMGAKAVDRVPGMQVAKAELGSWYDWTIRKINPEALGPQARLGAAIIAKHVFTQAQQESAAFHRSATRRTYWNNRQMEARDFIAKFESGHHFEDPTLNKAAQGYRNWGQELYERDVRLGLDYEPEDNYLFHVYKDSDKVAQYLNAKFGTKWGDPGFIKDRAFQMYEQARKAGFTPKYENPEDIMLARQHATDVAEMQINTLREFEEHGLAVRVQPGEKAPPENFSATRRRAPNGESYWVQNDAFQVMHNAWDSHSLWNDQTPVGKTFRGAMYLKNTIVPIRLAASLFHPLHVATIHNITGMVRASKEMLSGKIGPGEWLARMTSSALYRNFINDPIAGGHLLRAFQGKIEDSKISAADRQAMQYMAEGGMIPELSSQYRTKAWQNFTDALQQRKLSAVFKLPLGVLDKIQGVVFQHWIPSLKIASYLKDVETALKTDPSLLDDSAARMQAFRKLAKSVDNRYGEMAYNTLFWDRTIKDLAVANTLSLGWQMGFLREYGGGTLDLGQWVGGGAKLQQIKQGKLDRALFYSMYTAQAMAYGGLLTWAMTGQSPQSLTDYINPKVGTDEKGRDKRVSTMFYPREFMSIYKHMQASGVMSGFGELVSSKASGVIGLAKEWATGVDSFGQEIADPNAPAYKQLEQKLAYTLTGLEPLSLASPTTTPTDRALAVAGFSPAPKYITQSDTQNRISSLYRSSYAPKQTPFDRAALSEETRKLRQARDAGDMDAYDQQLSKIQDKFGLTGAEMNKIRAQSRSKSDPSIKMFSSFTWQDQKALLDKMTPEEREVYLPHSNKDHLRRKYQPPGD